MHKPATGDEQLYMKYIELPWCAGFLSNGLSVVTIEPNVKRSIMETGVAGRLHSLNKRQEFAASDVFNRHVDTHKSELPEAQRLLYVPPGLTFTNSKFCPHSVFVCFVWISEQTAIISLYSINWLVFITETECLLRGTDWLLYKIAYFLPYRVDIEC
jgi:hypothetical protein